MSALLPVSRPVHPALVVEACRRRIAAGLILHSADGSYTVGRYTDVAHPDGCFALLTHGQRAAHTLEAIGIEDSRSDDMFAAGAARYFVRIVGPADALASLDRTERPWGEG